MKMIKTVKRDRFIENHFNLKNIEEIHGTVFENILRYYY